MKEQKHYRQRLKEILDLIKYNEEVLESINYKSIEHKLFCLNCPIVMLQARQNIKYYNIEKDKTLKILADLSV